MKQSFQGSEKQHLLQIVSFDLLNRMAEIQKLRAAIQSAEGSRHSNPQSGHRETPTIIGPPAEDDLRA